MADRIQPGWYPAEALPHGMLRYWDGQQWVGEPKLAAEVQQAQDATDPTSRLSSPGARLGARIIDWLILLIPSMIILLPFMIPALQEQATAIEQGDPVPPQPVSLVLAILAVNFLAYGYEYYFLSKDGATPGKKQLGIKVLRTDGSELDGSSTFKRLLLGIVIAVVGLLPFIGTIAPFVLGVATIIMIFADSKRQTPPDKVADTVVVKV